MGEFNEIPLEYQGAQPPPVAETTTRPEAIIKPPTDLQKAEMDYIDKKAIPGLKERYEDAKGDYLAFQKELDEFATEKKIEPDIPGELKDPLITDGSVDVIRAKAKEQIDLLIQNPEKNALVAEETQRYLALVLRAKKEGDLSVSLSSSDIYMLVRQNILLLAYQDRIASKISIGDHGVRHIIGHNINAAEQIAEGLQKNGHEVKAIDLLILHQTMINHDVGYALSPVRDEALKGNYTADAGHNVLSAKYLRQSQEDQNNPLSKLFFDERSRNILHKAVLNHDSSEEVSLSFDQTIEARDKNIYDIVRTADNTDAFANKLPEILYGFPDTLVTLRLLKTAAEVGDDNLVNTLKQRLITQVSTKEGLPDDDRQNLILAANSIQKDSYAFVVPRICGKNPEFSVSDDGTVTVKVQESAIHREVTSIYGLKEYSQLVKFIADVLGIPKAERGNIDLGSDRISSKNGKLNIELALGEKAGKEITDYERRIQEIVHDVYFQELIIDTGNGDSVLSLRQKVLEADMSVQNIGESDKMELQLARDAIVAQRKQLLVTYLKTQGA